MRRSFRKFRFALHANLLRRNCGRGVWCRVWTGGAGRLELLDKARSAICKCMMTMMRDGRTDHPLDVMSSPLFLMQQVHLAMSAALSSRQTLVLTKLANIQSESIPGYPQPTRIALTRLPSVIYRWRGIAAQPPEPDCSDASSEARQASLTSPLERSATTHH